MAERQVRRSRKDRDGDITALCGSAAWGIVSKQEAIRHIDDGIHTYYVHEVAPPAIIDVVPGVNGRYLRSRADRTSKNNLDNLPGC